MKSFLLILSFSAFISSAFACTQEAQFSSVVKKVTKINATQCQIDLDLNLSAGDTYNPSFMCPLDIEEVYENGFISTRCNLKAGDAVSGYLVKQGNKVYQD